MAKNSVHLTPVFSNGSALLHTTEHSQPLCHQSLSHAFALFSMRRRVYPYLPTAAAPAPYPPPISSLESSLVKVVQNKGLYLALESTLMKKRGRGPLVSLGKLASAIGPDCRPIGFGLCLGESLRPQRLCVIFFRSLPPFTCYSYKMPGVVPLVAAHLCKFGPLFSISSKMLRPQPFCFHAFALLPGVYGRSLLRYFFTSLLRSSRRAPRSRRRR
jgi:hypothetical protein